MGDERIQVPAHLLSPGRGDHYVLRVVGDSMIGEGICDGDYIVVLRRETAEPGELVVATMGDALFLRRYYLEEGGIVRLESANPSMEPIRVPAKDLRIQGIAVGLMRKW